MILKIVHCADFHIGASLSQFNTALAKERRSEILDSLKRTAEFCKEKEVDALIISGDLFDTPKPSKADTEAVKNIFSSISPIDIYIICGNHDYMCPDSPFTDADGFSDNVHIFPAFEYSYNIPDKNAVIWGKSYSSQTVEPSFSECVFDESKINIMLLHGDTIEGSSTNIISKETLASLPCSYAAFGHIHAGEIFSIGNVKCAYSGAVEGHSFKDSGTTGIIYAEISETETNITQVDFSLRKHINLETDITAKSEKEIIAEVKTIINDTDFFRITLKGEYNENAPFDIEYIKKQLEEYAHYIDIADESYPGYDFDAIEKEESLRGAFLRELRERASSEEEFVTAAKVGLDALGGRLPGGVL